MLGLILHAHIPKGPFHIVQLLEPGSFGQKGIRTNLARKRWVLALQKSNDGLNGL